MKYEKICRGIFISRPNRFVAKININGDIVDCHVKNTGRCKELLTPGCTVILEDCIDCMRKRKLRYSLVASYKKTGLNMGMSDMKLINMDSQAPNKVVEEALLNGDIVLPGMSDLDIVQREKVFENSRFDFYIRGCDGTEGYVEVKGVTLEQDGVAMFPDAPTARGVKHIYGLMRAARLGYITYIVFVIQMNDVVCIVPNYATHPEFGDALKEASACGVHLLAYNTTVEEDSLRIQRQGRVELSSDMFSNNSI